MSGAAGTTCFGFDRELEVSAAGRRTPSPAPPRGAGHVAAEQPDEPGEQGVEFAAGDQPSDAWADSQKPLDQVDLSVYDDGCEQTCLLSCGRPDVTTHYSAVPRSGISEAVPAPNAADAVASARGLQARRRATETDSALPADPFARRPRVRELASHRLSGRPAVFVLASLIVALLASSAAPTPLYAIYQARWHFTPITTTVVFGVYALAVLASLLTVGKLSDHVGRRPVLLTAIVVHAGSLVIFATATGVPALLSARVVQGLSTGAALGAIGAAMLDMDRELGTFANAVAPGTGTATGTILSALAVRFLPDPTHLIYLALIGVLALLATAIIAMRETVSRAPGALASLRPEITVPRALRGPVLTAVPVLFAVWALAGLYGALGPALVHALTGSGDVVLDGLSFFVLAASAVVAIIVLRRAAARTVMLVGILALVAGVTVTVVAVSLGSASVFFAGSAIAGAGFGCGFQGGIRTVVPLAAAHERAGLVSLLYVVSYLGLGVPAVLAGFGVVHGGGLLDTSRYYGAGVIALSALALFSLLKKRPGLAAEPAAMLQQEIQ
jgi:predicted MFS family arabinose efflux permease